MHTTCIRTLFKFAVVIIALGGMLSTVSATPDSAQPDSAQPDSAQPDSAQPDSAQPDSAQPDSAQPEASQPAAQEDGDAAKTKDAKSKGAKSNDAARWSYFPIILFSPETSLVLGGLVLRTFRIGSAKAVGPTQRRSVVQLSAAYSLENQFLFNLSPTLFLDRDQWQVIGGIEGSFFPSSVYPLGNDSDEEGIEDFVRRGFSLRLGGARILHRALRAGIQSHVNYTEYTEADEGGLLDTGMLPGSEGGWITGIGGIAIWDDRDSQFDARSGGYYLLSAMIYRKEIGGDYNFGIYTADARRFFGLPRRHGIALQLYGQFTSGDAPFESLAFVGGPNRLRGFFAGRFRDNHMGVAQVEYRLPVVWRMGATVFAGAGRVANSLGDFSLDGMRAAGGLGLRFALNPQDRINLRFDIAGTSTGDLGIYFQLGEAF